MRRSTLERLIRESTPTEIVYAVKVMDYEPTRALFDKQQKKIAALEAEIAQHRMLLREALAQLGRHHEAAKSTSTGYWRLVTRADVMLTPRGEAE